MLSLPVTELSQFELWKHRGTNNAIPKPGLRNDPCHWHLAACPIRISDHAIGRSCQTSFTKLGLEQIQTGRRNTKDGGICSTKQDGQLRQRNRIERPSLRVKPAGVPCHAGGMCRPWLTAVLDCQIQLWRRIWQRAALLGDLVIPGSLTSSKLA